MGARRGQVERHTVAGCKHQRVVVHVRPCSIRVAHHTHSAWRTFGNTLRPGIGTNHKQAVGWQRSDELAKYILHLVNGGVGGVVVVIHVEEDGGFGGQAEQ